MTSGEQMIAIAIFFDQYLSKVLKLSTQETQCLRVGNDTLWIACNSDINADSIYDWLAENNIISLHDILNKICELDLKKFSTGQFDTRTTNWDRHWQPTAKMGQLYDLTKDQSHSVPHHLTVHNKQKTIRSEIQNFTLGVGRSPNPGARVVVVQGRPANVEGPSPDVHAEQKLIAALIEYKKANKKIRGDMILGGCKPPCGSCVRAVYYACTKLHVQYAYTDKFARSRWESIQDSSGHLQIDDRAFIHYWNTVDKVNFNNKVNRLAALGGETDL